MTDETQTPKPAKTLGLADIIMGVFIGNSLLVFVAVMFLRDALGG